MSHALTLKAVVRDKRIALLDEMAFHRGVKTLKLGEGKRSWCGSSARPTRSAITS